MKHRPPVREGSSRQRSNRPAKRNNATLVFLAALVIFSFCLFGMIGVFGGAIGAFLCGIFGFMGFAFFALALLATVFKSVLRRYLSLRGVLFGAVLTLILLLFLQVVTSYSYYDPSFRTYVNACYQEGLGTSGGVLTAWITFPLLSLMGKTAAIPLVVLFFIVLFFALFPFMRAGKAPSPKKEKSDKPSEKKAKSAKSAPKREEELRLFVDRVRPGQKDGKKIKFKGLFSKRGEEPRFFDYTDDTSLSAPKGVIPEERAERYDLSGDKGKDYPVDDYEEYTPPVSSGASPSERGEQPTFGDEPYSDLPPFIKNYRKNLQGDRPEEFPVGDPSVQPTDADKKGTRPERDNGKADLSDLPKIEHRHPKARPSDIISDISDLRRHRENADYSKSRTTFLGEELIAKPTPVSPARQEQTTTFSDSVFPDIMPDTNGEEEGSASVITPRDASVLKPKEPFYRATDSIRTSFVSQADVFDLDEEPARTRKPRSDLGGTHRTSEPKADPMPRYIPPNKVKQPDIEEILQEEEQAPARPYVCPPVGLLADIPPIQDDENVEEMAACLVRALHSFNIDSQVVDHKTGPTFTQFAVTLPDNMSVNKLTPLEKDIKRKLMVEKKDIRIIPSVPGLDAVGIEVPNKVTSPIGLRSIINSPVFKEKNKLMFAIGVDVSGKPVYGNLLKMPHLLVAGATGSGKSVCLNVIICSILYHYPPDFVRFIMVDPKKVELSVFRNMPHMLIPSTVTDSDKAINALSWLVDEMERRYDLLMNNGCKDIESYNEKMEARGGKKLYYIVFIIDEMADLMYTARKEVDEKVNRIAAKARAAGINLILATQRPSVDVITGTIKNNLRAKIAFKVGSFVDSKTIIDRGGAESLFGNGDMLYMASDGGEPTRLQGPLITEKEIESIVDYVKQHNDTRFDYTAEKNIFAAKEAPPEPVADLSQDDEDGDEQLIEDALLYFINNGQASISKLQIKYHIGYGRAARIVDTMAERGYLGPAEGGNKSRQVRITLQEYYDLYGMPEEGGDPQ